MRVRRSKRCANVRDTHKTEQNVRATRCSVFMRIKVPISERLVLSVSVVLSVVCGECRGVSKSNDLRCVFERYDAACHVCATRKNTLGCHLLNGEKFLCGQDHSGGENTCKHLGF